MQEQVKSWLEQYATIHVDYGGVVDSITLVADWIGFLTVF
jgi:hypothetical protein